MRIHTVIFDLDGTLIDSAPSILISIRAAFDEIGIQPVMPLTFELIGPPLHDIFLNLLSEEDKDQLPKLLESFKNHYDSSGYKDTKVYEAVTDMLDKLQDMKIRLYIATNKRILPTLKILDYLGWRGKFEGIYTLDNFYPPMKSKIAILQYLYNNLAYVTNGAVYVGDREEDAEAAKVAGFPFLWAVWGYGRINKINYKDLHVLSNPSCLFKLFHNPSGIKT